MELYEVPVSVSWDNVLHKNEASLNEKNSLKPEMLQQVSENLKVCSAEITKKST